VNKTKYALLIYATIGIMVTLVVSRFILYEQVIQDYLNDFASYYYASQMFVNQHTPLIYDQVYSGMILNGVVYRYFPSFLVAIYPLTLMPLLPAYATFEIISMVLNVLSIYISIKIMQHLDKSEEMMKVFLFLACSCLVQVYNYSVIAAGQVSNILLFLLMLSLWFNIRGKENISNFILGIAFMFKPPIMIVLLVFQILSKDFKKMMKRAFFVFLPMIFDICCFLFIPGFLSAYYKLNFEFFKNDTLAPVITITNAIETFTNLPILPLVLVPMIMLIILGYWLSKKIEESRRSIFYYMYGIMVFYINYQQIWDHEMLYLFPFIALWLALNMNDMLVKSKKKNKLLFALLPFLIDASFLMWHMNVEPIYIFWIAPALFLGYCYYILYSIYSKNKIS
jgi:hypothetical protein